MGLKKLLWWLAFATKNCKNCGINQGFLSYNFEYKCSFKCLSCIYIGDAKHDVASYFLALANRNDPICVAPLKVAKASTVTWLSSVAVADGHANKCCICKWSINFVLFDRWLRFIYTSDFRGRFNVKPLHFREFNIFKIL